MYYIFSQDNSIDVVAAHRGRNRPVNPPQLENLADAAAFQHGLRRNQTELGDDNPNNSTNDADQDEDKDEELTTRRARRYSKRSRDAEPKPTTMKYYPPGWQAMLETAKNHMRRYVALVNAFPQRETDLKNATMLLSNAITEYEQIEGNVLEPG
jgi:hypothetical protein